MGVLPSDGLASCASLSIELLQDPLLLCAFLVAPMHCLCRLQLLALPSILPSSVRSTASAHELWWLSYIAQRPSASIELQLYPSLFSALLVATQPLLIELIVVDLLAWLMAIA